MMMLPLVSIITPSLNQGQYIGDTINSVLKQNYPNIQYLVIDGGSKDTTIDILRCYSLSDRRFQWISEPDVGQSSAINKGWRLTHGEIIAWLNSDDTYLPSAISRVVAFFHENPSIDAVYGDCAYVDEAGRHLYSYPTRPYDYRDLVRGATNYIPQPATFIRRSVLESIGYLDESLNYVMDFDYWLRMGIRHKVAYMQVRLATLRLYAAAKSVKNIGDFAFELLRIYERVFSLQCLPQNVQTVQIEAMSNVHYHAAACAFWAEHLDDACRLGYKAWCYCPFRFRPLFVFFALRGIGLKIARSLASYSFKNKSFR